MVESYLREWAELDLDWLGAQPAGMTQQARGRAGRCAERGQGPDAFESDIDVLRVCGA
ncbi:MAG: hypothetical protein JJ916_14580 [Phycisphaerales bacterium]|nr:hypothetical protein [Phycisphaerales bacterium]